MAGARQSEHFPGFDGLRAIAALAVIGVHTTFVAGLAGNHQLGRYTSRLEIGVEVFFVISGFLLYRPFAVAHFGGRPALPVRSFWIRRLKRIIPAYWLAFVVITYVLHADQVVHTWYAPLVYLGFAQIYIPAFVISGIPQAWSLCTEMSFYLMIPLWAALLGRRSGQRRAGAQLRVELLGVAALVAISFAWRVPVLQFHTQLTESMPNWLPGYLDQFALGVLLAVTSSWLRATRRRPRWLESPALPWLSWGAAALAYAAVANIGLPVAPLIASPVGLSLLRQTLYGAFAFFLVAPAVFGPQDSGLPRRLLRLRPLALIGAVSYGVYLWHEAWIELWLRWTGARLFEVSWPVLAAAVTALAIATATLSYLLVERPVLSLGRAAGRAGPLAGAATPAPPGGDVAPPARATAPALGASR